MIVFYWISAIIENIVIILHNIIYRYLFFSNKLYYYRLAFTKMLELILFCFSILVKFIYYVNASKPVMHVYNKLHVYGLLVKFFALFFCNLAFLILYFFSIFYVKFSYCLRMVNWNYVDYISRNDFILNIYNLNYDESCFFFDFYNKKLENIITLIKNVTQFIENNNYNFFAKKFCKYLDSLALKKFFFFSVFSIFLFYLFSFLNRIFLFFFLY